MNELAASIHREYFNALIGLLGRMVTFDPVLADRIESEIVALDTPELLMSSADREHVAERLHLIELGGADDQYICEQPGCDHVVSEAEQREGLTHCAAHREPVAPAKVMDVSGAAAAASAMPEVTSVLSRVTAGSTLSTHERDRFENRSATMRRASNNGHLFGLDGACTDAGCEYRFERSHRRTHQGTHSWTAAGDCKRMVAPTSEERCGARIVQVPVPPVGGVAVTEAVNLRLPDPPPLTVATPVPVLPPTTYAPKAEPSLEPPARMPEPQFHAPDWAEDDVTQTKVLVIDPDDPTRCPKCTVGRIAISRDPAGDEPACMTCGWRQQRSAAELEDPSELVDGKQRRRQPSMNGMRL